jgi:hypothetical protein
MVDGDVKDLRTLPEGLASQTELVIVQVMVWADHFPVLPSVLIVARVQTARGRVVAGQAANLLYLVVFGYMAPCQQNRAISFESNRPV